MKYLFITVLLVSFNLFAAEMTKEQRAAMADVHEKMAACLKSDKPMEDCKKEMHEGCKAHMGEDHCGMMDHMDKHRKMMGK